MPFFQIETDTRGKSIYVVRAASASHALQRLEQANPQEKERFFSHFTKISPALEENDVVEVEQVSTDLTVDDVLLLGETSVLAGTLSGKVWKTLKEKMPHDSEGLQMIVDTIEGQKC